MNRCLKNLHNQTISSKNLDEISRNFVKFRVQRNFAEFREIKFTFVVISFYAK
jgi:hypothetical protein